MQAKLKTYTHLTPGGRLPSEYDIVSSQLLYYKNPGFSVDVPQKGWYEKYQKGALLQCRDWEAFRDPRATTYKKYTELQTGKEAFVTRIFRAIEYHHVDALMDPAWRDTLNTLLPPLRYVAHAGQMISSYIGHMAPSGRITIVFAMQAADHLRIIECLAYRMAQIRHHSPTFGDDSAIVWHTHPAWQPLRKAIELILVTYDWSEAFVAFNHHIKPALDALLCVDFAHHATRHGDSHLASLLASLHEDALWHQEVSNALLALAMSDAVASANQAVLSRWADKWVPLTVDASKALTTIWQEKGN